MQAVRRLAVQAGLLGSGRARAMATIQQIESHTAKSHGSPMIDNIGMYTVIPLGLAAVVYDYLYPEEEFEGKIPRYPYMRMRTREDGFPWGPNGLFEHHVHVDDE